ncbi:MAG: hypothetical protein HKL95_07010 [Phycisphaerae bacterium]|nr:hypothetical protein [Phycisphaerae bacterium]
MAHFVKTNAQGQFTLNGKPWFFHGSTYFGRRPGTCCGSWLGEHFAHNFRMLRDDVARMKDAGLNAVGLFLPGADFYQPADLQPNKTLFEQLDRVLDVIARGGLRSVVFPCTRISRETWCRVARVQPGAELWNAATSGEAERCLHWTYRFFLRRYADRPEVIGTMGRVGRFDFPGWNPPRAQASPVHSHWHRWLKRRFGGNFSLARKLLDLTRREKAWNQIALPPETPAHFSRESPRAFEYALMQQVLISQANRRLFRLMKTLAPRQLSINDMEGVEFAVGLINVLVPELVTADVLWLECYNWEGMRGTHDTSPRDQQWLVEPVANKPTIDLIGNAGYVQMLVRWMQQSAKALILCHGTDIGNRRGVPDETTQALMIDRFNAYIKSCDAYGINYWCWTDDELSRSAVLPSADLARSVEDRKRYQQAGETMGLLRFDGSERPALGVARATGRSLPCRAAISASRQVLVLFPTPLFQSLYRYRSNCTGFGIFTALARQGIFATAAFTSTGENFISPQRLARHRLIILATPSYTRDHPEVPPRLLRYVKAGGTLFLPLALPDKIEDPYVKVRPSPTLAALAGCAVVHRRQECRAITAIESHHRHFATGGLTRWNLPEPAWLTHVTPTPTAEILVSANGSPLLYRHRLGHGMVYVFTWSLDVYLFNGAQYDYSGGHWDWLWQGLAAALPLRQDVFNPMTRAIREMSWQGSVGGSATATTDPAR